MQLIQRQFAFEWMLLAGLLRSAARLLPGKVSNWRPRGSHVGDRRRGAQRKQNIATSNMSRIVVRDSARKDAADPAEVTTLATRRVVLQGDRSYVRYEAANARRSRGIVGSCSPPTMVSAAYGHRKQLREHSPQPLHSPRYLPGARIAAGSLQDQLPPLRLSRRNRRDPPTSSIPQTLADTGSINVFARVVARFDGEEPIDGLRCVKVRVDRWFPPHDDPFPQYLWLAVERNYHCVQEQYLGPDNRVWHDMHVADSGRSLPASGSRFG